jgi:hypothetical protein
VGLFCVERQDLPCHFTIGYHKSCDRLGPEAAHGFEPVAAVGRPESIIWSDNGDDRIEEPASLVDDVGKPFVMGIGEIPLKGCRLYRSDRQNRKQQRVSAQRFFVLTNNTPASFFDCFGNGVHVSAGLFEAALGRTQALGARFRFTRTTPRWCPFDHCRNPF